MSTGHEIFRIYGGKHPEPSRRTVDNKMKSLHDQPLLRPSSWSATSQAAIDTLKSNRVGCCEIDRDNDLDFATEDRELSYAKADAVLARHGKKERRSTFQCQPSGQFANQYPIRCRHEQAGHSTPNCVNCVVTSLHLSGEYNSRTYETTSFTDASDLHVKLIIPGHREATVGPEGPKSNSVTSFSTYAAITSRCLGSQESISSSKTG
ncbi:uncharacterized protein BT62DRAFT_924523 [Guyanagaster necrorhizus]|uniref:Uncharacterized protein n=1 Tax=Guyanagaster necrorhizus TaxID=856835 RepID=A0A9P7VFZ5_9AGAR|nr:uncharacterized protein BT62DRAFT_924523 [Guyanagaster necrorhizus MCA 3950]KAG7439695.1 hypothetical protein BT62DRAFT_924523 [Guyanagaster necrorhizus MCA 3950]